MPAGVVTTGDIAGAMRGVGAAAGFLCGFLIGTAVVARAWPGARVHRGFPRRGTGRGRLKRPSSVRSSAGWGEPWSGGESPSVRLQRYEMHVGEGRFLVFARTHSEGVEYSESVLALGALDQPVVYEIGGVNTWPPQRSRPTACSCGLDTPREVGGRNQKRVPSIGEARFPFRAGSGGGSCDDRRSGISDHLRGWTHNALGMPAFRIHPVRLPRAEAEGRTPDEACDLLIGLLDRSIDDSDEAWKNWPLGQALAEARTTP